MKSEIQTNNESQHIFTQRHLDSHNQQINEEERSSPTTPKRRFFSPNSFYKSIDNQQEIFFKQKCILDEVIYLKPTTTEPKKRKQKEKLQPIQQSNLPNLKGRLTSTDKSIEQQMANNLSTWQEPQNISQQKQKECQSQSKVFSKIKGFARNSCQNEEARDYDLKNETETLQKELQQLQEKLNKAEKNLKCKEIDWVAKQQTLMTMLQKKEIQKKDYIERIKKLKTANTFLKKQRQMKEKEIQREMFIKQINDKVSSERIIASQGIHNSLQLEPPTLSRQKHSVSNVEIKYYHAELDRKQEIYIQLVGVMKKLKSSRLDPNKLRTLRLKAGQLL